MMFRGSMTSSSVIRLRAFVYSDEPRVSPYAAGLKYSTMPAPIDARQEADDRASGWARPSAGEANIEYEHVDDRRPAKDERHHVERNAAGPERVDDADGADGAERCPRAWRWSGLRC